MEGLGALKIQMDQLAKRHAEYFYKVIWVVQKVQPEDEFMEHLKEMVDFNKLNKLLDNLWLNGLNKVNKVLFNNGLKNLIRARQGIIKSMISDYSKTKSDNDEIFGKYICQVYELLTTIFQNTTCNEKNIYFHTLVDYYYLQFTDKLEKLMKLNIARLLPVTIFEHQIKIFLPIVKLEKMVQIAVSLDNTEDTKLRLLKPFVLEIYEYFKYPNFLREDCLKILEDHVGPYSYKLIKFKLLYEEEDLYKLNVTYYREDKEESLSLFVKHCPDSTSPISFSKEEFFYTVFVPCVARYVSYDTLSFATKCYFVRKEDILVLDDVSSEEQVSNLKEYTEETLKQLAKFHACSLILKKMNKAVEEEFKDSFTKMTEDGSIKGIAHLVTDFILEKFPDFPIEKEINVTVFRDKTKTLFNEMFQNLQRSSSFPNVICHGNLIKKSIACRINPLQNTTHYYLVNCHSLTYCPPVLDLLFFLYSNTTRDFRNKSMSNLLKKYYEHLSKTLTRNNVNINDLFDFDKFLESGDYFKQTALCMCLCPREILQKVTKKLPTVQEYNEMLTREGLTEDSIKELVEELYEICEK